MSVDMIHSVDLPSLVAQFKALISEICKEKDVNSDSWTDYLDRGMKLCSSLPELPSSLSDLEERLLSELSNSAVALWNFSVALKTKGSLGTAANAKLRHIALFALEVCDCSEVSDNSLRRRIMMGLKTGRAWLDCGNAETAEAALKVTDKCLRQLQKTVVERRSDQSGGCTEALDKLRLEVEEDMFTLLCHRAEANVFLGRQDEALKLALMAKELLSKFPKQGTLLSMLCYNLGIELYQKKLFEEAIVWLRESYELGKGKNAIGPKNQARTLRVLANAYLELDATENCQKAHNAVSLANTEHMHPAGLFLCLKILLLSKETDDTIKRALGDLLKLPDLTVDLSLHVLQLINQYSRLELMTWLIEELLKKFHNSPDIGKLLTTNLEVLLQGGLRSEAKEFVEYCITAHHTGKPLDLTVKQRLQVLLWEQAAAAFEGDDQQEALDWYNYSLSLYPSPQPGDLNLAKLHRNRANCYLAVSKLDKAKEAITEAERCDPSCVFTQFISYKITLLEDDNAKACQVMQKLCECAGTEIKGDNHAGLSPCEVVALAAQQALESDKLETASVALEYLSNNSKDFAQVFTALRCLVRLKLAAADQDMSQRQDAFSCISCVRTAYNKLLQWQNTDDTFRLRESIHNEASWFTKIAWNLALQCEDQPATMKDFFCLCSQLISLSPLDEHSGSKQETCMLMSAAACLQLARNNNGDVQQRLLLEETLDHVSACRQVSRTLREQAFGGTSGNPGRDSEVLLLLYEFEARTKLRDPAVEAVLEKALTLTNPDPKTFETLAALAMEPPAHNKSVSVRALKVAVRKQLQSPKPDIAKCSQLYHSLVHLCLDGTSSQLTSKEEAWSYYIEIYDVIEKRAAGQYPEMEMVWLMAKAWNCGINLYSGGHYSDAAKWCEMSMKMLKYLNQFRTSYQDHMNSIYSEILAKVGGSSASSHSNLRLGPPV